MILYILWDVDPRIFSNFEYLRWYGISWVLGIVLGQFIMSVIYKKEGISTSQLDDLVIYVMVGGVIGARLGHILFYDPIYYFNNPMEILPFKFYPEFEITGLAGLASHGGILGAFLGLYIYNRKYKKAYLWMLDRLVIAGAALGGVIRLGNLMNSEIIGIPTDMPWAFVFARIDQIPRHPAQLYEALFYFIISGTLFYIWKTKKYYEYHGFLFGLGFAMIFIQRFLVEFVKENQVAFEQDLFLNMGQILSIPMILVGVGIMMWSKNKKNSKLEA